ncbi:unnamed protein product [Somion occarium]|uniref:Sfi1 spindle body domain-containing protein n=1 Tax=Somion occarium TaxID=3059160 RepID=A0ABP1DAK0_9APHY
MNRFAPPRASSPAKSSVTSMATVARHRDDLRPTASSLPVELQDLTTEEIAFIDEVVGRSPPNAAHFLAVFKAYNDILAERGVNPGDEVVYYGKLLKLGTLKGSSWTEKWNFVKSLQAGPSNSAVKTQPSRHAPPRRAQTTQPRSAIFTRLTGTLKNIERDEDAFTLHSHQDDTDTGETTVPTVISTSSAPHYRDTPRPNRRAVSPTLTATTTNTLGLHTGPPSSIHKAFVKAPIFPSSKRDVPRSTHWKVEDTSEESTDTVPSPSTVPPSYGAATRGNEHLQRGPYAHVPLQGITQTHPKPASVNGVTQSISGHLTPATAREAVLRARERSKNVANEEDAWEKIRRDQDEKEADRFREEKLIERCWDVWKQGYQWITTTHEQIAQARDNLILRLAIHRWRNQTAARLELYRRVSQLSNDRRLKLALNVWKVKFRERKQAQWRDDMRNRMKLVREKREFTLLKDAWAKWRQSHRSHLAELHHNERLVGRFLHKWRGKLEDLEQLNAACDMFLVSQEDALVEGCWDMWRRTAEMRKAERIIADRAALRMMTKVFDVWKSHMSSHDVADQFYDKSLLRRMFGAWKAARDRIQVLERRADKHVARQNDVLIRAVMRVWKAHERGRLLERVRSARLLKDAWAMWKHRLQIERERKDAAIAFSTRPNSVLAASALHRWQRVLSTHRKANEYAVLYSNSQLCYKMLLAWRLHLRTRLKMARQAKQIERHLAMRRAFRAWVAKLEEKRREQKVKVFEQRLLGSYFQEWRDRVKREQELRLVEEIVQQGVSLRIMSNALHRWIDRVSDQTDREIQTTELYEQVLLVTTFRKWSERWTVRVNEKSLLQSFRDIKREEKLRRIFYRWLSAARQARHKRLLLEEKEQAFRLNRVVEVWDKWREKLQARRLQPLADEYVITRQTGLVFRAFGIWHAKTKSLPAIHFYNSHLKAKVWKAWRDSVPNPAQSKIAREKYQKAQLAKVFNEWSQAYKAKMALKAVARARYLRLPIAVSRQPTQQPRTLPPPAISSSSISSYRRTAVRPEPETPSATEEESDAPTIPVIPRRTAITSLFATRPRSALSEDIRRPRGSVASSRPKLSTRAPSPTASVVSEATQVSSIAPPSQAASSSAAGVIRRSRLLQELEARGLTGRSRPSTHRLTS